MALYQQTNRSDFHIFNSHCLLDSISDTFTLEAVFKDKPNTSVSINLATLQTHVGLPLYAAILSACPAACPDPPLLFNLTNFNLQPLVNPNADLTDGLTISISPGGTPNFQQFNDAVTIFDRYCVVLNPLDPSDSSLALTSNVINEVGTILDPNLTLDPLAPWALCSNNTAEGRLDVVWKGVQDQPGYNLTNCRDVVLKVIET
ncbi:hypothetical protein BDZ97DRAFT_1922762 [Flammula alnicola]|nr:hypothetical protein BDZ97DRAFT_1922762 [Flammula alnicola]